MDKIAIASDHAGFPLKDQLADYLKEKGFDVLDLGTNNAETSVDYPLEAEKLVHTIKEEKAPRGILVCGSGIGMCMAANRYPFIRAALVYEVNAAHLARQHNDANVLCLGARMTDFETAKKLVDEFLNTPFEGGRHERRILELGGMK
ncbi:MAG: ribose 5-phosphate isomerase B [Alphaproteobacteria bacterium]